MIVPFPPGGPNDILGRVVAEAERATRTAGRDRQSRRRRRNYRRGARCARVVADGYTLLFGGTASLAINPSLHRKLPYYALCDFAAIQ